MVTLAHFCSYVQVMFFCFMIHSRFHRRFVPYFSHFSLLLPLKDKIKGFEIRHSFRFDRCEMNINTDSVHMFTH